MPQTVFIILFRGVGGQTKLPTGPLRAALTEAGFRNVATYIASGNAVLSSSLDAVTVKARVAAIAKQRWEFTKEIIVFARREWAEVIAQNPYPEAVDRPTTLHAFALASKPGPQAVTALADKASASERVTVIGRVLYFHSPDGFGISRLPPVIDRTLGVTSTARNWNTVVKLDALASEAALL